MSRSVMQAVLSSAARSTCQLLKSLDVPPSSMRVVELADGFVVMLSVCPAGERLPTLLADAAAPQGAPPVKEGQLPRRVHDVLQTVRKLRGIAPGGHLGPHEIRAELNRLPEGSPAGAYVDEIGKSTVGHALTELVRLKLLVRTKKDGYSLPLLPTTARLGTSAAG